MTLAELQRQFQQHVLMGDARIADLIEPTQRTPVATRLGIYSSAYHARLIEALAASYPRLRKLMGDEAFNQTALEYIAGHPSHFRSVRWFGALLAASLELSHRKQPWLADLAQWEWTLAAAFDAPDSKPIDESAFAAVPADHWPGLRFAFHPSVQRLGLHTNAPALFKALSDENEAPPPQRLPHEQQWLIWRQNLKTRYRSLDAIETRALDAVLHGAAFEKLCEALCACCDADEAPLRAASLLRTWLSEGLIASLRS